MKARWLIFIQIFARFAATSGASESDWASEKRFRPREATVFDARTYYTEVPELPEVKASPSEDPKTFRYTDDELNRLSKVVLQYLRLVDSQSRPFLRKIVVGPDGTVDRAFLRKLRIETPIDEIESIFRKYQVIQLRKPKATGLLISCGNGPLIIGSDPETVLSPERSDPKVQRYLEQHQHNGWDTLDQDIRMNPGLVASIGTPGLIRFLKDRAVPYESIYSESGWHIEIESLFQAPDALATDKFRRYEMENIDLILHVLAPNGNFRQNYAIFEIAPTANGKYGFSIRKGSRLGQVLIPKAQFEKLLRATQSIKIPYESSLLSLSDEELNSELSHATKLLRNYYLPRVQQLGFRDIEFSENLHLWLRKGEVPTDSIFISSQMLRLIKK